MRRRRRCEKEKKFWSESESALLRCSGGIAKGVSYLLFLSCVFLCFITTRQAQRATNDIRVQVERTITAGDHLLLLLRLLTSHLYTDGRRETGDGGCRERNLRVKI